MSKRRKYTSEFKCEAVELAKIAGVSTSQVVRELGINRNGPQFLDSRLSVFCPHMRWPDHAATGHIPLPT